MLLFLQHDPDGNENERNLCGGIITVKCCLDESDNDEFDCCCCCCGDNDIGELGTTNI